MEAYEIMQVINGSLLMICMALAGALWKNIKDSHKGTEDDVKHIYKLIHTQQNQLAETLTLAKLNQQSIERNQQLMQRHMDQKGIHYDLAERIRVMEIKKQ